MTSIYLHQHCALKTYSANSKPDKTVIKIEIETTDHREAGWLLSELKQLADDQKAAKAKPKAAAKPAPLALPAPLLQLEYFPEDDA